MPGIVDVAAAAGVSVASVSRVLSDKPHVRPELRARVLEAVERLGYQPSRVARSLRLQRSQVFGVIVSDVQNPFFTTLVRAVEDVAHQHQHAVFLCNSDEDPEKERLYVDLMEAEQVAGVIITPTMEHGSHCRWLLEAGIPVVAVDRRVQDCAVDTVLVDNRQAASDLIAHLLSDGHRRIGIIAGPSTTTTGRERLEGYQDALVAFGISPDPALICQGLPTAEVGFALAGRLLDSPHPPSALFASNNMLAAGALRAIRRRRLRIPDDIALAAFDDAPWMELVEPPITVVAQQVYELGAAAAQLLLDRLHDRSAPPQEHVLPARLRIRNSCAHHG